MKNFKKQNVALLAGMIFSPMIAFAQSTQSVAVPVNTQTVQVAADRMNAQIDLLKEIRKQKPALNSVSSIDIQMISFEAKSGIGGATVYLKINQGMTNYVAVETDPDVFSNTDPRSYQRFELKNNDRSRINSAAVYLPQYTNVKLNNLTVTLGSAQEPAIFGRYVDDVVREIGGAPLSENRSMTPNASVEDRFVGANFDPSIYGGSRPVAQPAPAPQVVKPVVTQPVVSKPVAQRPVVSQPPVSTPRPAPAPPKPVVQKPAPAPAQRANCLTNYEGSRFCVGGTARLPWGNVCEVLEVSTRTNNVLVTCPDIDYGAPFPRHMDMLKK